MPLASSTTQSPSSWYMPAEWTPHKACLILFPHNPTTFHLPSAQQEVLQVAKSIATQGKEKVFLLAKDATHRDEIKRLLEGNQQPEQLMQDEEERMIQVFVCPSNDTWVRDTGPTICHDRNTAQRKFVGIDWDFNAYGGPEEGCYWPCVLDRQVAKTICQDVLDVPSWPVTVVETPNEKMACVTTHISNNEATGNNIQSSRKTMVLEGGSIHTDGDGTLLVTEECLLNSNRNPHLSKDEIEATLMKTLGVDVVIWLPFGVDGDDDTNGHVDNFCCFVKPGHVILSWTDDQDHDRSNYDRCRAAESILLSTKDAKGRTIEIHKLQLPPPMFYTKEEVESLQPISTTPCTIFGRTAGERMAASYVNFYISNHAIIVPQFGIESTDRQAITTLERLFSGRSVVGVYSRQILVGGGNIHCITQQVPA